MKLHPLLPNFFNRPTVTVARDLLGHYLVYRDAAAGQIPFRIVETEAYTEDDPASHAYRKTTGRAANLYKAPGLAYVYLIYGMYHCLNVVTEPEGVGGAVLFRALEPPHELADLFKTHGPGRLCKALGITGAHNGLLLTSAESQLFLAETPVRIEDEPVIQTTRVGIQQAKEFPWRFYLPGSRHISVRDRQAEADRFGKR